MDGMGSDGTGVGADKRRSVARWASRSVSSLSGSPAGGQEVRKDRAVSVRLLAGRIRGEQRGELGAGRDDRHCFFQVPHGVTGQDARRGKSCWSGSILRNGFQLRTVIFDHYPRSSVSGLCFSYMNDISARHRKHEASMVVGDIRQIYCGK